MRIGLDMDGLLDEQPASAARIQTPLGCACRETPFRRADRCTEEVRSQIRQAIQAIERAEGKA
jgi:hypothetical protein